MIPATIVRMTKKMAGRTIRSLSDLFELVQRRTSNCVVSCRSSLVRTKCVPSTIQATQSATETHLRIDPVVHNPHIVAFISMTIQALRGKPILCIKKRLCPRAVQSTLFCVTLSAIFLCPPGLQLADPIHKAVLSKTRPSCRTSAHTGMRHAATGSLKVERGSVGQCPSSPPFPSPPNRVDILPHKSTYGATKHSIVHETTLASSQKPRHTTCAKENNANHIRQR